jgi:death-on-curing protein
MPEWITLGVALAVHDAQIAEHGGAPGARDLALLESALARPQNLAAYGEAEPDIARLAAAYACSIARNHPFIDANKRTSNVVALTFLELNGYELIADDAEQVAVWPRVADGSMKEAELADWLRKNVKALA